jgi:hypothetical protein
VTRHQTPPLRRPFLDQRDERELRGKRALKTTIEKLSGGCLDVGALRRFGIFGDTRRSWSAFRWPDIAVIRADRYSLELEMPRKACVPQQIRVSWTRCHFGRGLRPWLHCPHCQGRVAKLFNGLAGYCCRACVGNPSYASQAKSAQSRRHFEACKLRLRLGGNASLDAPFPERPKGMHRRTYARLKHRAEQLEAQISSRLKAKPPDYPNLVYYFDR